MRTILIAQLRLQLRLLTLGSQVLGETILPLVSIRRQPPIINTLLLRYRISTAYLTYRHLVQTLCPAELPGHPVQYWRSQSKVQSIGFHGCTIGMASLEELRIKNVRACRSGTMFGKTNGLLYIYVI